MAEEARPLADDGPRVNTVVQFGFAPRSYILHRSESGRRVVRERGQARWTWGSTSGESCRESRGSNVHDWVLVPLAFLLRMCVRSLNQHRQASSSVSSSVRMQEGRT